jgi:hypothetical protein
MYSAFLDANGVPPLVGTIPAIFAKSSMLWTSVIYICSNKRIRSHLLKLFGLSKAKAANNNECISRVLGDHLFKK